MLFLGKYQLSPSELFLVASNSLYGIDASWALACPLISYLFSSYLGIQVRETLGGKLLTLLGVLASSMAGRHKLDLFERRAPQLRK